MSIGEIYQASLSVAPVKNIYGSWTRNQSENTLKITADESKARRTNLTGLHLRCVTMHVSSLFPDLANVDLGKVFYKLYII